MPHVILIGAPIDDGQRRAGCLMGPAAYRVAGLAGAIRELGHAVQDWGDLALPDLTHATCPNPAVHSLPQVLGWTQTLCDKVDDALSAGGLPIILGGDHSLALGSVAGAATFADRAGPAAVPLVARRPQRFSHAFDHHLGQPARHPASPISPDATALTPFRPFPP